MRCQTVVAIVGDKHERSVFECDEARPLAATRISSRRNDGRVARWGRRVGARSRGSDCGSSRGHVEVLLAIVPDPSEDVHTWLDIGRHLELELLTLWTVAAVAIGTVALM